MKNLAIDPERLWGDLMETARIGATVKGGICRLTLTDLDRQVRGWFRAQAEALGCTVTVDDMGNMFARRPGTRDDVPPIAFGSHLDTQPTGGKFDGALGVLAALEAMRTLVRAAYETFAPVEVVNWTNEEGARFTPAMLASGVFAGVFTREHAVSRADREGETFGNALDAIGYRGPERCGEHPLSAFFELHIEQGPYLEAESKDIGVVTGVQAMRWYEVTVVGQDSHAGTTPMPRRRDALAGAAHLISAVESAARAHPPAVGTVGRIEVKPGSFRAKYFSPSICAVPTRSFSTRSSARSPMRRSDCATSGNWTSTSRRSGRSRRSRFMPTASRRSVRPRRCRAIRRAT
jgi:N-carbamoyl-L-amino-acid hydrolase